METWQNQQNFTQSVTLLYNLAKLPFVCQNCGHIETMKNLQNTLNTLSDVDINRLSSKLVESAHVIQKQKNQTLINQKMQINQSLEKLKKFQIDDISLFQFENIQECLERVCEDIFANIYEQIEIQNSLNELSQIIQDQQFQLNTQRNHQVNQEIKNNFQIKERLEGAFAINQSHKQILKEILIKIAQENQNEKLGQEIQVKQLQLDLIDVIQKNSEQALQITELGNILNEKIMQLMKFSQYIQQIEETNIQNEEEPQLFGVKEVVSQKISPQGQIQNSHQTSEQFYSIIEQSFDSKQSNKISEQNILNELQSNVTLQSFSKKKHSHWSEKDDEINNSLDYYNPLMQLSMNF